MQNAIKTISLPMPLGMGSVNCYLIETESGYVLIDTGGSNKRQELISELKNASCKPGNVPLIVLTHGDFDHTGNAAYLRRVFGSQIAMHTDDEGMGEQGDMFVNRNQPNILIKRLLPIFSGFGKAERFKPDFLVIDGDDLTAYGLEAKVVSIPGHSKGSIGILTADGTFFCGDLMDNINKPGLIAMTDDKTAANASLQKLRSMDIGTVYPGHGRPFTMDQVRERNS